MRHTPPADHVVDKMKRVQVIQHHHIQGKGVMVTPLSLWLASDLLPQGNRQTRDSFRQRKKSLQMGGEHPLNFSGTCNPD